MSIADKYIRMITAMIKTYRAFQSQNNLQRCYKELVMTRRVIRMQGKYETIIELIQNDDSTFMKLFKVMQLLGEFADLGAFWTEIIAQTGSRLGKIS